LLSLPPDLGVGSSAELGALVERLRSLGDK
jgi:hypothetical protein